MDYIGVGSLVIIILTGFFTGGVLILQAYPTFAYYGVQNETGRGVATSLIRELGPVLTALMVSGRVGSSISAELGSMVVSQQIEAMRALGTSPVRKLVTPRITALLVSLPLLTVVADILGILGGGIVATSVFGLDMDTYFTSVKAGVGSEGFDRRRDQADIFCADYRNCGVSQRLKHGRRNCRCRTFDNERGCHFVYCNNHRRLFPFQTFADDFGNQFDLNVKKGKSENVKKFCPF